MEAPSISLRNLTKTFGQKLAVDNFSLDIPEGSLFGLVGPNGAGKTTTLSMLTGILEPTHGEAWVLGRDVWRNPVEAKALMGVLPDGIRQFDRLTGRELLRYTGLLRGVNEADVDQRAAELIHVFGLEEAGNTLVVDYSAGMKKKIGLASALIHAPKVVILDEPFEAVDPVSSATIRKVLGQIVHHGGTVVLSSHVMELVEQLCDRVAVVHQGRLIASGTVDEVRAGQSLQQRFVELVGGVAEEGGESLAWLEQ
jgi:ABC-2 type transport system ATP-binding protein